ncbi:MAG: YdcF family protein [Bacteroidetes bacterium]|nr:MAG: YdcF family protein [Bacteroidota bacterium]
MFFILSKLFYFLLSPFVWFIIALLFAFFSKKDKRRKIARYLSLGILIFFSNAVIFLEVERWWEVPATPLKQVENYDVGIVLGGMFEYNQDVKELSVRRGADRIWQALNLYKMGKIRKILISGGSGYVSDRGLSEGSQLKEVLLRWGIPKEDLLQESISRNTYENAVECKKLLSNKYSNKKQRVLLITSGQHMRRARAIFKKQGLDCATFSTDLYSFQNRNYHFDHYVVPSIKTIAEWTPLIKEWVGYIVYDVMDYL